MNLLLSTDNKNKLIEIQELLKDTPLIINSIKSKHPEFIQPPEDGKTFEENALIKIRTIPHLANTYYLSDDSGLEVSALNGRPGIYSARYGGEGLSDKERTEKLLEEMKNKTNRNAQFKCVLALIDPEGNYFTFTSISKGTISLMSKGTNGFGYDPIFIPKGYNQTFAEGGTSLKQQCSHRSQALKKLVSHLKKSV